MPATPSARCSLAEPEEQSKLHLHSQKNVAMIPSNEEIADLKKTFLRMRRNLSRVAELVHFDQIHSANNL
jgi:hypothetical protein